MTQATTDRPRHGLAALACAALATLGGAVGATAAHAQAGSCDAVFADPNDLVSASAEAEVAEAANALASNHEFFVRARLIDTTGTVGLDTWAEDQLAACPSWQQADTNARTDLVLLVVAAEDRTIGSYFGDTAARVLDGARREVHAEMGPALGDDLAAGMALGLGLYDDVARQAALAPTAGSQQPDSSSGSSALPWALGGAVVVGAGAAGGIAWSRRRKRLGVQAVAMEAKTAAMSAYYDLEERWVTIAAGVTVMTKASHPDDGVVVTMIHEADEAERALAAVRDALLALPDPAELHDRAGVDAAVPKWHALVEQVEAVRIEVEEVDAAVTALQAARSEGPARIEDAAAAAGRAADAVRGVREGGFLAEAAERWLADAERAVEAARTARGEGRHGDAVAAATTATERAEQAFARAQEIPTLAADLPGRADELERQAEAAADQARRASADVATLSSSWQRTVWDDISDADARAGDLATSAKGLAGEVRAAAEEQDWEEALAALDEGQAQVAEALELAAAPAERHAEAEAQLAEVNTSYDEARRELAHATNLLSITGPEVGPYRSAIKAAERQLATGLALLKGRPDPIRAATIAAEARTAMQNAVNAAHKLIEEFERATAEAESLIQQGRSKLREAERSQPRTAAYRRDVQRAEDLIDDAQDLADDDPDAAIDKARRGLDLANQVIRDKRRDRDRDRDDWRASPAPVRTRSRSTPTLGGGTVLGGSPRRPAPRARGGFGGGGSSKRGGFGGGGSSKF